MEVTKLETMYFQPQCFLVLFIVAVVLSHESHGKNHTKNIDRNDKVSNETTAAYSLGVHMGIINPHKYTLKSFERDERNIFKDSYKEYISLNGTRSCNYQEWLVMNNFGILSDTQESLFDKITKLRAAATKLIKSLKTGDILISGRDILGLLGHAAMMSSNSQVLEMTGGEGWANGLHDNNRQISKEEWFKEHTSDSVVVYRCPDSHVAKRAARWAVRQYFNPKGGKKKIKHITFRLTKNVWNISPSYCSKLVIQAYYYGGGKKKVVKNLTWIGRAIIPTTIPSYFLHPYKLIQVGRY